MDGLLARYTDYSVPRASADAFSRYAHWTAAERSPPPRVAAWRRKQSMAAGTLQVALLDTQMGVKGYRLYTVYPAEKQIHTDTQTISYMM